MYVRNDYNNSIAFNALLGAKLKSNLLEKEFGGDVNRLNKFEKLFRDSFEKNIDSGTVIDMNDRGKLNISNMIAPEIYYPLKSLFVDKSLAHRLLKECDKVYSSTEYRLFQRIISTKIKKGESLKDVSDLAVNLGEYRRPYFLDLIGTAAKILNINPKSKLTEVEFSDMITKEMREVIETPEFQKAMSAGDVGSAIKILES